MYEVDQLVPADNPVFDKQVSRLCRRVQIGTKPRPQLRLGNILRDRRKEFVVLFGPYVLAQ